MKRAAKQTSRKRTRRSNWTNEPCWLPPSAAPEYEQKYGVPPGAALTVITDENGALEVEWQGRRFILAKDVAMPAPPGSDPLAGGAR
jgi:hypothetical protein